ncbi:DUF4406 domain-containing protein (plasmid) [Orbus sturtevantii]|uniref:DUF4406 domain-containing protein n=1 Tax=Orbus sturtevantii TaxID=3074109 RepID=UPI00370D0D42
MKIYIAGPISGYKNGNREAFTVAEEKLNQVSGNVILNPSKLPKGLSESEYMDICMAMIRCADAIYLLNGWKASAGASAEYAIAYKLGLKIMIQN